MWLCVGIWLAARAFTLDAAWAGGVGFVCALVALVRAPGGWWWRVWSALAVMSLGAAWYTARAIEMPRDSLARIVGERASLISIDALVLTAPVFSDERRGRLGAFMPATPVTRFEAATLGVRATNGTVSPARGTVLVRVDGDATALRPGSIVRLAGNARRVPEATNPGEFDRTPRARSRGVAAWMDIDAPGAITSLDADPQPATIRFRSAWATTRAALQARARQWLDPADTDTGHDARQARALLRALLLGQDESELRPLRDAFQRLGVTHILAISGLNLVLLTWAVVWLLRWTGDRPRLEALVATLLIAVYLMIVPAEAPVVRAAVMVLALLLAEAAGRRYDRVTILAWAGVIVLILDPVELFGAGFQLSFGVVWALLVLGPSLRVRLFGERPPADTHGLGRWFVEGFKDAASASVCAWAAASPIVAYHVGVFSPLGAVATVLLMPIVGAVMVGGYLTLLAATIVPALGSAALWALESLAGALAWAVFTLDAAPWAVVYLPRASPAWTACTTATIAWWMADWKVIHGWCAAARRRVRPAALAPGERERPSPLVQPKWLARSRWAATAIVALWLVAAMIRPPLGASDVLRLDTLDVGDGSCHLVRVRDDAGDVQTFLFDCGSLRLTVGERLIPRAVRALGVWRVPTVVISHANIDHYAGLLDVVGPLGVRRVIVGEGVANAAAGPGPVGYVMDELRRRGVEVRVVAAGDDVGFARVVSPPRGATFRQDNDYSLVLRVAARTSAGERSLLLCGDASREALAMVMQSGATLRADVMEVPHHGSHNEVAEDFVQLVAPSVAVQSTGLRRLDDTRWDELKVGRDWRITARDGAVSVTIDEAGEVRVMTWKDAR